MQVLRKHIHRDQFRIKYYADLPNTALEWALSKREEWMAQGPENARVVVLTSVPDYDEPVVLKFHPTVQRRHAGHRTKGSRLRQFMPRYAAKEVDAFLRVHKAGLATPLVLAWGERWQWLQRYEGVVVTQFIPSEDLECRLVKGDMAWIESAAKGMAKLHNAGLVHRDAYPQNFFEHDNQLQMIDLDSVRELRLSDQIGDLIGLFVPIWVKEQSPENLNKAIDIYREHCHNPPTDAQWQASLESGYKAIHKRWQTGLRSTRNSYVINEL